MARTMTDRRSCCGELIGKNGDPDNHACLDQLFEMVGSPKVGAH
jgi:hypothetical protein